MKYYSGLFSLIFLVFSTISFALVKEEKVLAIGCDTYYRVTGEIAGCNDISTEDVKNLWLKKYSVCLKQQLSREISIYNGKLEIYYTEWQQNKPVSNTKLNEIFFQDLDTSSLSLSESQSTTYKGNADFCQ